MSEIAQDTAPRIFIVTGTNFSSEVSFEDGDMNLECGLEQQVYECGSRVIAALNGDNPHNLQIVINNESKASRLKSERYFWLVLRGKTLTNNSRYLHTLALRTMDYI